MHRRGCHHDSMAGLTSLQYNRVELQESTTGNKMSSTPETAVWPQPVCFLSVPFAQKVLALRQGTELKHNFPPETINKIPIKVNETSKGNTPCHSHQGTFLLLLFLKSKKWVNKKPQRLLRILFISTCFIKICIILYSVNPDYMN